MSLLNLGWREDEPFQVDADTVATGRTCILGASGSGKSYTVGVLCEELCRNKVPFMLIDNEGEYFGLKQKYEAIWIGDNEQCDLKWDEFDVQNLASRAPDMPPLIADLSEADNPREKIGSLLSRTYREISTRRTPYLVILEEADKFVPQIGDRLQIFDEIARRGRKRGLGLVICTQRPSLVDKNILSQCGNQLIGKLVIQNDLQAVSQFFPGRGLPEQLTTLTRGEFYATGGLSPTTPSRIKIRTRETPDGGMTPKLTDKPRLKPSKETFINLQQETPVPVNVKQLSAKPSENISQNTDTNPEKERLGLSPLVDASEVALLVKREKSFVIFGEEEIVAEVNSTWRPIVQVGVRVKVGMVKKRFETLFFLLDGVTGQYVELADRLVFREGLDQLIGLSAMQIELLRALQPDSDSSFIEVAGRIGVSDDMVRKEIGLLERRRLVRSSRVGRIKMFRRTVDLPRVKMDKRELELEAVNIPKKDLDGIKIKKSDVKEVIEGLFEQHNLESFEPFSYPLYRVKLLLGQKSRTIWIDGRTGKNVEPKTA
ncbi:MAG: DUF87 domain-containing protein [Thaumarchaeota archaeon]|nr:DUF87 domain-containing protein [Nitrososphaerota archaeon]MCL5317740.1 DUF87 domain-containing protein [Nitrososphaerota archaeon]